MGWVSRNALLQDLAGRRELRPHQEIRFEGEVEGQRAISCHLHGKGKQGPSLWPCGLTREELTGPSLLEIGKMRRISKRCGLS